MMQSWVLYEGFNDLRERLFQALVKTGPAVDGDEIVIVSLSTNAGMKWFIALKRHKGIEDYRFWHNIDTGLTPDQSGSDEFNQKIEHLLITMSEFAESLATGGITVYFTTQLSDLYIAAQHYKGVVLMHKP